MLFVRLACLPDKLVTHLCGRLTATRLGRRYTCLVAYIAQMIAFLLLIFYRYHTDRTWLDWVMIVLTISLLALGDSVWESQPPAILQTFYGLDRDRNAAMANLKMWQSLGNCIQFALGVFIKSENHMVIKSIILASALTVGYVCLVILDLYIHKIDMVKGESRILLSGIDTA